MHEAGLAAAALQARGVIIVDKPAVIAQAADWRIALTGFE
jgi:hypothetical protein